MDPRPRGGELHPLGRPKKTSSYLIDHAFTFLLFFLRTDKRRSTRRVIADISESVIELKNSR